ncbi:MAG TPA: TRAP transporter large permease [Hyphomicrobiales bacterium]|nr:TRAP transporter large permease [Hyphomicrobiales bacterium]
MTPQTIGLLGLAALIVLTFLRVPLGAAMGIVGLLGYAAIDGWDRATIVFGTTPYDLLVYSFSVLPLFILMGVVATGSGMSKELFAAASAIFSGRRGALSMATIGGCAGFAAICGSSLATAGTFTSICVPEMRKYGYDERVATGSVAAGGTLGILIPPSVIIVIYALAAQESVPELFAAGLIPGLLMTVLFMAAIWITARLRPDWMPASPRMPWWERLKAVRSMWKLGVLFGFAVGGIYAGWFSPTEAAGVAAFAAILIAVASRTMTLAGFVEALMTTLRTTAMLMFIITGAWIFAYFIVQTRVSLAIVDLIEFLQLPPFAVVLIILSFYLVLGCFLESVAVILVTVPVFLPIILALGFDPVWYGILMVVMVEVGLITPPVGLNIFVIRAQLPDVSLGTIYKGIIPFLLADAVLVGLLIAFPQLALWLPGKLF